MGKTGAALLAVLCLALQTGCASSGDADVDPVAKKTDQLRKGFTLMVREKDCNLQFATKFVESWTAEESAWNFNHGSYIAQRTYVKPVTQKDDSRSAVMVRQGSEQFTKNLSADGVLAFSTDAFKQEDLLKKSYSTFDIRHSDWDMAWTLEIPYLSSPDALRDWDIFTNELYDYRTRMQALCRLRPYLDRENFENLFSLFLNGKTGRNGMPAMSREFKVEPQP